MTESGLDKGKITFLKRRRINSYDHSDEEDGTPVASSNMTCSNETLTSRSKNIPVNSKLTKKYGVGAKLLSNMGYIEGKGLGKDCSGIATPIETQSRPGHNAGLGMFSRNVSSSYHSEDEEQLSSGDELADGVRLVKFNKTSTETLGEPPFHDSGDIAIVRTLRELKLAGVQLPGQIIKKLNPLNEVSKPKKDAFVKTLQELLNIERSLEAIRQRISPLELQIKEYDEKKIFLSDLEATLKDETSHITLFDKISAVLKLSDDDLIDRITSNLLSEELLLELDWGHSEKPNDVVHELTQIIELLTYRMDTASNFLNRTQTAIFKMIYPKLEKFWKEFDLTKSKIDIAITLLLDFEQVLNFIECKEHIMEEFIYPKLFLALDNWKLHDEDEIVSPRVWVLDFMILIDDKVKDVIVDKIETKFLAYCKNWYHRESFCITNVDITFIKEVLCETRYYRILWNEFLPKFLDELWERHNDPIFELEDWKKQQEEREGDSGFFYFMKILRSYTYYFHPKQYELLIRGTFNNINKILYQWHLYSTEEHLHKSKWWLNWLMNTVFEDSLPTDLELLEVRKSYHIFAMSDRFHVDKSILDEDFNIRQSLRSLMETQAIDYTTEIEEEEPTYSIHNVPLAKVGSSFKDVVEDYCLEKGYLISKIPNTYTQLPYGRDQDCVVPLFQIQNGKKTVKVALKHDILWLEDTDGAFRPTYLWALDL